MKTDKLYQKLEEDRQALHDDWQNIQDAFSQRLADLGQAEQALVKLEAVNMYDKLYSDYVAIRHEWQQALDDLGDKLTVYSNTRRTLAEAKENVKIAEQECIAAETHKEGAINGSNAEKRKGQTIIYLASLRKTNSRLKEMRLLLQRQEMQRDELEIDIENLKGKISFLRNLSRMNSGLTHALAG